MNKYAAYIMTGLARIWGGMSLLAFVIFLFVGSLNLFDMHLDESGVLWFDAGLSLLFFIQHSVMVRKRFRRWLARFIPEDYARATYAIASGIAVIAGDSTLADIDSHNHCTLRYPSLVAPHSLFLFPPRILLGC